LGAGNRVPSISAHDEEHDPAPIRMTRHA
jgi:hypothetical protein